MHRLPSVSDTQLPSFDDLVEAEEVSIEGAGVLQAPPFAGSGGERTRERMVRIFDLAVCLLVLPAALLVGAVTALLIFIDSPGPVFFRSLRVGREGSEFEMLKFRKMHRAARGAPLTTADDERFTPIGRFLALTKLDELPQLWNVIRGEMRLVGPRPEVPEFVARYRDRYDEILTVLPGITGPAAIEYSSESHLLAVQNNPMSFYEEQLMPRKIDIDLAYVRGRSMRGDLAILGRTALVPLAKVLRRLSRGQRIRRLELLLLASGILVVCVYAFAAGT